MNYTKKNKIVICSNYAWTIKNFRMGLIENLRNGGYQIFVITEFDGYERDIRPFVNGIYPLKISRQGTNPFYEIVTVLHLLLLNLKIRPSIVLAYTIKPNIYIGLISWLLRFRFIPTVTGLGTAFIKRNLLTDVVVFLYRLAFGRAHRVFFQNNDDLILFAELRISSDNSVLVPGSGIDMPKYYRSQQPADSTRFLFIGRVISDKGIIEFCEAAREITQTNKDVEFEILGPLNIQNLTAVSKDVLDVYIRDNAVRYLGKSDDVRNAIEKASCIVLPSYREGLPRALLEASAMGKPVIATDVPGCRDVVAEGLTGFLCEPKSVRSLVEALTKFIDLSVSERELMGERGRHWVAEGYSQERVNQVYNTALSES